MFPAQTSSNSSGRRKVTVSGRVPSRSASTMNRPMNDSGELRGISEGHNALGHNRL